MIWEIFATHKGRLGLSRMSTAGLKGAAASASRTRTIEALFYLNFSTNSRSLEHAENDGTAHLK